MKINLLRIPAIFLCFTMLFILQKPLFMLYVGGYNAAHFLQAITHGTTMDMTMAGYLTAIPAILAIASVWAERVPKIISNVYFWIVSTAISVACVSNMALYPFWGFPLDSTVLFYLSTSLSAALASVQWWMWAIGIPIIALMAWAMHWILRKAWAMPTIRHRKQESGKAKALATIATVVEMGLLFIPIRGGFTVATMNPSRAYFSPDLRLNHATVNPLFNLMYSMAHQDNFSKMFRFMDDSDASSRMAALYPQAPCWGGGIESTVSDTLPYLPYLPDVHIILLESFSSHLMPSMGGEAIAMNLDSIANDGLLFTNIYSSSFRTDRGLSAILSGYPAQPTTSISKYVGKLANLPGIAKTLRQYGYETEYYYGGDANFSNKRAMLASVGFNKVVTHTDFPVQDRLSKWGVHDHILFARALDEQRPHMDTDPLSRQPRLVAVQTLSSHEPFDVPYQGRSENPRINAFQYTDSCLGAYMRELALLPSYRHTLVVIVPDHYGAYPQLDDPIQRHRIPLVITGGAIQDINIDPPLLSRIGSQTDIAATILSLLGLGSEDFCFSNNLFDPQRPEFAFFSEPSWIATITPDGFAQISVETGMDMTEAPEYITETTKAYAQKLYDDLDSK